MMRAHHVNPLVQLYLTRMVRQLAAVGAAVLVLASLDIARHGVRWTSLSGWLLGGALILPMMQAMLVVRQKVDGSLRFLASLPVSGQDHATARAIVAALLTAPSCACIVVALRTNEVTMPAVSVVAIALGSAALVVIISLALTAVQLRTKIGQGLRVVMVLFVVVVVAVRLASSTFDGARVAELRQALLTARGIAITSAIIWMVAIAVAWWSLSTIARVCQSYEGEDFTVG